MRRFLRWRVLLLALVLLVILGQPVLAQGGSSGQVVFGRDFTLGEGQRLYGDLVVFGGNAALRPDSSVRGDVATFGGSVQIDGRVDGDVFALGGDVRLGEGAIVSGDVVASGDVIRAPGAIVHGKVMASFRRGFDLPLVFPWTEPGRVQRPIWGWNWPWGLDLGHWLSSALQTGFNVLLLIALGVLVVLLAPAPARRVGDALAGYTVQSIGVGLLTGLAAILVVPILILTCIGIPVAVLLALVLAIAALFGWIAAGLVLGERLLVASNHTEQQPVLAVALGLLVLGILSAVPCLGFLVWLLAGAWGLGAVALTAFGTRPYRGSPPAAAPIPPEPPDAPLPPLTPPAGPPGEAGSSG